MMTVINDFQDQDLVSVIARFRNTGSCFQQFSFSGTLAPISNNRVSEVSARGELTVLKTLER